ncbi:MAG: hypothetical protein ABI596_13425 [Pyrinomonadaceae bacterium]
MLRFDPNAHHAIRRTEAILTTNVFLIGNHPLRESAFIELLIRLHDLLQHLVKLNKRISFTDDVNQFTGNPKVKDITDAIRECRHAVCHMRANASYITPDGKPAPRGSHKGCSQLLFCCKVGKGVLLQTPRYSISSDYDDDMCFFYGAHKLYLKRHIIRAFEEARNIVIPPINVERRRYLSFSCNTPLSAPLFRWRGHPSRERSIF